MAKINMIEDLGAPAAVAVVNIVTKEVAPDWNEWAHYIMTAAGYACGLLGVGGGFLKNLGVASLSGTVDHIYIRVKAASGGIPSRVPASKTAYRSIPASPVYQPVQRSYQPEFEAVAPHAF